MVSRCIKEDWTMNAEKYSIVALSNATMNVSKINDEYHAILNGRKID